MLLKVKDKEKKGEIGTILFQISVSLICMSCHFYIRKKKAATIFENKISLKEKTEDLFTHLGSGGAISHKI